MLRQASAVISQLTDAMLSVEEPVVVEVQADAGNGLGWSNGCNLHMILYVPRQLMYWMRE